MSHEQINYHGMVVVLLLIEMKVFFFLRNGYLLPHIVLEVLHFVYPILHDKKHNKASVEFAQSSCIPFILQEFSNLFDKLLDTFFGTCISVADVT